MRARASCSARSNAPPSTSRKATAPTPVAVMPERASSVSAAGGTAKRSSRLGSFGLERPSSASKNPIGEAFVWRGEESCPRAVRTGSRWGSEFGGELLADLVELCQSLLQAGVRREGAAQVEEGQVRGAGGLSQVLLRYLLRLSADLHECGR